jgi:hypothetical protein
MVYLYDACDQRQKSDIWSQASYRYSISWEGFLDPSDSYFLFADFVGFYTHWTYMLIFRHIFLSNYWWQESDIWSPASYRYAILWEACELMLTYDNPALRQTGSRNLMGPKTLPTIWGTYIKLVTKYQISAIGYTVLPLSVQDIFRRIFLSNCWWQKSDIWSQASYRYTILWVAFLDPSDSYFLYAEERGYHRWALAHSQRVTINLILSE